MALGMRKRRDELKDPEDTDSGTNENDVDLQALFQQHFEAKFRPLEPTSLPVKLPTVVRLQIASEDGISDWEGLPEEEEHGPEVIELEALRTSSDDVATEELRSFMGNKPPGTSSLIKSTAEKKQPQAEDLEESASEAAHLKKDLALQRLLKESHLLEPQSTLSVSGKNRHKALDLRLQDLGSKSSIYAQHKMPMAQRKGINAKATETDEVRRREAQENGIILEKATNTKKGGAARRKRALGTPAVGKFRGGMLKLSKRDVAEIQGPKKVLRRRR